MNPCHVLVVDPHIERRDNLAFLLRLARFEVALVRDELEAINWTTNNEGTPEAFALMIISHFSQSVEESEGVAGLHRLSLRLPILQVIRPGNQKHTAGLLKTAPADCRFSLCTPADILTSAKRIWNEVRETSVQPTTNRS